MFSTFYLALSSSDYTAAVWPITFGNLVYSFLHHLLHIQCYCPYAMWNGKKRDMKKAETKTKTLINISCSNANYSKQCGEPKWTRWACQKSQTHRDLWSTPKGGFSIPLTPVYPPHPNHSPCGSAEMTWTWPSRCINICVNLSFFVVYEYLSWSGWGEPWNFHVTCG